MPSLPFSSPPPGSCFLLLFIPTVAGVSGLPSCLSWRQLCRGHEQQTAKCCSWVGTWSSSTSTVGSFVLTDGPNSALALCWIGVFPQSSPLSPVPHAPSVLLQCQCTIPPHGPHDVLPAAFPVCQGNCVFYTACPVVAEHLLMHFFPEVSMCVFPIEKHLQTHFPQGALCRVQPKENHRWPPMPAGDTM